MIRSLHNWPSLLDKFLAERMNAAFVWGKHDCCLFACDAVLEMTGFDLAIDFRGKYDSALSAVRAMRAFTAENAEAAETNHVAQPPGSPTRASRGGVEAPSAVDSGQLVSAVASKIAAQYQINEIPVPMAQRGDVALVLAARGESLGIVSLHGNTVLSPGEKGLVALPLKSALKAWRIPKS